MRGAGALLLVAVALLALAGCAGPRPPRPVGPGWTERGIASWYGPGFHGRRTANGERYDMEAMTAAHKELPFGTQVEVRNLDNGRVVRVRINDRGPFVRGRVIDLSRAAARAIDMLGPGTARVELRARFDRPALEAERFTVQVGAFRDRDRALDLAARLRPEHDVVVEAYAGWHRVRVGGARGRRAALELAAQLRRRGYDAVAVAVD